jgi:hypothetical protein
MRRLVTVILSAVAFSVAPQASSDAQRQSSPPSAIARRFIGTWRLVSIEGDSGNILNRGPHPTGLIYYDATGHMAAQIMPDRPRPSWPQTQQRPTPDQARDAIVGYTAYFGTYVVDERAGTVTHHREGALNFDVVDYVRRYEFLSNDRLVLLPVDRPGTRLVWERIK